MSGQVGTIIARYLRSKGIRYEERTNRCHCYKTMVDMNRKTPEQIEAEIDYWTERVKDSSKQWVAHKWAEPGLKAKVIATAVKPIAAMKIQGLILWACEEAKKSTGHGNFTKANRAN